LIKIVIIAGHVLPGGGSAFTRSLMIAEGLSVLSDVNVELIVPRVTSESEKIQNSSVDITYIYNQNNSRSVKKGRWICRVRSFLYFFKKSIKGEYDYLIFYPGANIEALIYAIMSKIFRIKFCTHFADPVPVLNNFFGKIRLKRDYFIWNICIRLSVVTIVISKGLKRIVLNLYKDANVFIVPIITNSKHDKKIHNNKEIIDKGFLGGVVVYSGKFTVSSGIIELLQAVKISHGDWRLFVTGPINKKSNRHININDLILEMGLENKVNYLGYLDKSLYHSLLSVADVLVVPKSPDEINSNNFPGKLVEFLETGKPIVAANIGDISSYLDNGSDIILYDVHRIEDLEYGISTLINNKSMAYSIGKSGKTKAALIFDNEYHMDLFYKYLVCRSVI
jgi:glycosyltransferase involved in cell wall biosynthesis